MSEKSRIEELSDLVSNAMSDAEDKIVYDRDYYAGQYDAYQDVLDLIEDLWRDSE